MKPAHVTNLDECLFGAAVLVLLVVRSGGDRGPRLVGVALLEVPKDVRRCRRCRLPPLLRLSVLFLGLFRWKRSEGTPEDDLLQDGVVAVAPHLSEGISHKI